MLPGDMGKNGYLSNSHNNDNLETAWNLVSKRIDNLTVMFLQWLTTINDNELTRATKNHAQCEKQTASRCKYYGVIYIKFKDSKTQSCIVLGT